MPPSSGEGMSDSPSRGLSTSREPALEHAPDHHGPEEHEEFTDPPLRPEQPAPSGVDVKDLRPLRGRPFGPIPDPDASTPRAPRRAENARRKIKNKSGG